MTGSDGVKQSPRQRSNEEEEEEIGNFFDRLPFSERSDDPSLCGAHKLVLILKLDVGDADETAI